MLILAAGGVAAQTGVLQGAQPTPPVQQQVATAPPVVVQQADEVEGEVDGEDLGLDVTGGEGAPGGEAIPTSEDGPGNLCHFLEYDGGGPLSDEEFESRLAAGEGIDAPVNVIFHRLCYDPTGAFIVENFPAITIPGGNTFPVDDFFLLELEDSLPAEAHPLTLSPNAQQITGVETWIQEPPVSYLGPVEITEGGATASIQAHLRSVEIRTGDGDGDGSSFSCTVFDEDNNLASQFTEWTPGTTSETECGHTYWEVPTTGTTYQMEAVYHWVYSWKPPFSNDFIEYGFEPTETITFDVEVVDLEAVIGRR